MFKKLTAMLLSVGIMASSVLGVASVANAQSADGFSMGELDGGSNVAVGKTVDASSKDTKASVLGNFDFLGGSLVSKTVEFLLVYNQCFTVKQGKIIGIHTICTPRGQENIKENFMVNSLTVKDIIDGKFKSKRDFPTILAIVFVIALFAYIVFMKVGGSSDGGQGSSQGGSSDYNAMAPGGMGMGGMGGQSSGQSQSGGQGKGTMAGTVGGWFIEKFFGKDLVNKDDENNDDWTIKGTALLFIAIFFFFGNIFSLRMASLLPIAFSDPITSTGMIVAIGILYGLTYIIFVGLIFTLFRWMLFTFIRADLDRNENNNIQMLAVRTLVFSAIMIALVSFGLSWLIDLASIIIG